MHNYKGFTLVELLVAATIIGSLVVFATISYRNSTAESRWTQAKAKLDQLANAWQRFKIDYPKVDLTSDSDMTNIPLNPDGPCPLPAGANTRIAPYRLIQCGYLENGTWADDNFLYKRNGTTCGRNDVVFCVIVKESAKMPASYKNKRYGIKEDGVSIEYSTGS